MNEQQHKGEPLAQTSADLIAEQVARLRESFPECVSEGRVDFDKLRATLGDEVDSRPERYAFTWAGKRDAIRLVQTPSRATLIPCPEESVNFDATDNIFIEGDNLEVLKLIYKPYFGRVKMIYIDPPYNTGNDFVYPDNFTDPLDTYLRLTGQKDGDGNLLTSNPETSGRYHSAWLTMIYPRLFLARQLLRDDGFLIVSISDHEVSNLRLLLNEVFGEENFLAQLVWKSRQFPDARAVTQISTDHEYLVVYSRRSDNGFRGIERDETKFANPDNDPRGAWMSRSLLGLATAEQRPNLHYPIVDPKTSLSYSPSPNTGWRYSKERMQELIDKGCIIFPASPTGRPREKKFRSDLHSEFMAFPSIIDDVYTAHGATEIRELFGFDAFDFPKPTQLIRRLVEQLTRGSDLILDFFAGSCTTAHAVIEQNGEDGENRRFVMVQLPEPTGNKDFPTIAEIGKERIRRVISKIKKANDGKLDLKAHERPEGFGFRVFKLAESNYKQWPSVDGTDPEVYAKTMALFTDPLVPDWKPENVIWEAAIKEGYGLNARFEPVSELHENIVYLVTDPDKGQSFCICLENEIKLSTFKKLGLGKDNLFICRDTALDDETAANLALQCRLKTI